MAQKLTPPQPTGIESLDRWLNLLWRKLTATGSILWEQVSKTDSNLTDIETRNHNDLQSIQGGAVGEYYHLTAAEYAALGTGGATVSNVISTPTTVAADTSYIVMQYLTITDEFTVNGNVGIL